MSKPINQRGQWYKSHKRFIDKEIDVQFNQVKAGMILHINYQSEKRPAPKKSMYLVIQPKYHNELHVIDLDYVDPKHMRLILTRTKKNAPTLHEISGSKYCTILDFVSKNEALYQSLIRLGKLKEGYRTLHRDKIHVKTMKAVVYRFPDNVVPADEASMSEETKVQLIDPADVQKLTEENN